MNYSIFKMLKNAKKAKCDRPTDRQTNRPTDTVSCRVACTRLKNGAVNAWSCSLSVDIIAMAPSDNSFVNKSGGGIKGLPMSSYKW